MLVLPALGQEKSDVNVQMQAPDEAKKEADARGIHTLSDLLYINVMGLGVLSLTGLLLCLEVYVIQKTGKSWEDWGSVRMVGLTFVIGLGAFLVVAGYSAQQMSPVMALLGAALGYLFGNRDQKTK